MRIFTNKHRATIAFLCLTFTPFLSAGELEDLIELKKTALQELVALQATGIGEQHPQIAAKEKQIVELEEKITDCKETHEEMVILLKGTSSLHLQGHAKFGKTEKALPTLLLQGWKIKTLIPAGEDKAYVWLIRE
ncbi:MAG: hypothetical protein ACSHX6_11660 [Akkermansiaceae bacterium]